MAKYVNLAPRWTEILPTWLMMYRQAAAGDCTNIAIGRGIRELDRNTVKESAK